MGIRLFRCYWREFLIYELTPRFRLWAQIKLHVASAVNSRRLLWGGRDSWRALSGFAMRHGTR